MQKFGDKYFMDIKETHEMLLKLMAQFDQLCVDNGIQYTLHGGSLLGAIREHGFIPWDDDVDTAMTRAEFRKLEKLLDNNDEYYIYGDIKKQFRRKNDNNFWIDIFVCDYIGEGAERRKKLLLLSLLDIMYKDKNSIKLVNFKNYSLFKQLAYKVVYIIGKLFPRKFKINKYHDIAEFKYLGDKTYLHRSNDQLKGRVKVFSSEWMNEYTRVPFENIQLSVLAKYHEYLCTLFGEDYMTPIRDDRNNEVHEIVRGVINL